MMKIGEAITRYERILALSGEMVAAAEQSRWDDLIVLENTRRDLVAAIVVVPHAPVDAVLSARHDALIREILALDERVKNLTSTWMTEIGCILTSMHAERKLARAYNTG